MALSMRAVCILSILVMKKSLNAFAKLTESENREGYRWMSFF